MILNNEFTKKKDFRLWQRILVELLYINKNMTLIRKKLDYVSIVTMSIILNRLERAGLVEFGKENRLKVVNLTFLGEKIAKNFERVMSDFKNE